MYSIIVHGKKKFNLRIFKQPKDTNKLHNILLLYRRKLIMILVLITVLNLCSL